ncbi:MAG: lipase family protein [Thiothrix sp.]|uniref:lipase family protein n=1 Tax=Thiothrix sp. TaxID=1032 RepID=UPI0026398E59|nr:lipase family protein [Thiothrix sp.]MDD5395600.1 lipase family protein [Thiothrix sp.]
MPPIAPQPDLPNATISPLACKMLHASECAYQIKNDGELDAQFCGSVIQQAVGAVGKVQDDQRDDLVRDAAFIGLMGNDVIIAFRGTQPPGSADAETVIADWVNDAKAQPSHDQNMGTVHTGFLASLDNTWQPILRVLNEWKTAGKLGNSKIYITGHSKGGSIAQLAALRLKQGGFNVTEVYTFAASRAGGEDFASLYNAKNIPTWRFENQGDIVPHLPPTQIELDTFHALPYGILRELNGNGIYRSVGRLQYITSGLNIKDVSPEQDAQLNQQRLAWFKEEAKNEARHIHLFRTIVANHTLSAPKEGESSDHRYYRAVCGN